MSRPSSGNCLALFTIGEALSVGFVTSFYRFQSVVTTMIATAVATVSVSVYTVKQKNPKYDLSQWGSTISTFGLMFCLYGLCTVLMAAGVLPPNFLPYSDMAYGLIGATLFSFYLAYHTKLIVAGKHAKYQMNEQDYVFGAGKFNHCWSYSSCTSLGMPWQDIHSHPSLFIFLLKYSDALQRYHQPFCLSTKGNWRREGTLANAMEMKIIELSTTTTLYKRDP